MKPVYKISSVSIGSESLDNVALFHAFLPYTDGLVFVVDAGSELFRNLQDFNKLRPWILDSGLLDMTQAAFFLKRCLACVDISLLSSEAAADARANEAAANDFVVDFIKQKHVTEFSLNHNKGDFSAIL
jgi:hypothetical protein